MRTHLGRMGLVLALVGLAYPVTTIAQLSATSLACQKEILAAAGRYTNSVQRTVRKSITANLAGKSSVCDGGFACIGGANHGQVCSTNADCGGSGPVPGCYPKGTRGIAGALNSAKKRFLSALDRKCTTPGVTPTDVGFPTTSCPGPISGSMTFPDIVDCIVATAAGDLDGAHFVSPFAEPLVRAAGNVAVAPVPAVVCEVTVSSLLHIGVLDDGNTVGQLGGSARLNVTGCSGDLCDTAGTLAVGNLDGAPIKVAMGSLSFCLVTTVGDSGNGTSQAGQIDLGSGYQSSYAPIETDVHAGPCPTCVGNLCDAGPNAGQPCANAGGPDIGCQPNPSSRFATVPNPLALSTDSKTLTQIPGKPGICGACSTSIAIGCQVDGDCPASETCSYATTQPGFHGDASATSVTVSGTPSQYLATLAGLFCTGRTGNSLVDNLVTGLPGPVRYVNQRLNAYQFAP